MRSPAADVDIGYFKALAFSGPLLIFIAWQLYSVTRELEDDKESSSRDDENTD